MVTEVGFYNIEFPSRFPFVNTSTNVSGGAGHSLVDLITNLDFSQYDCKIFSVGNKKNTQKEIPKNNLVLYRFPTFGSLIQNKNKPFKVLPSSEIIFQSSKINLDLIHCWLGYPGCEIPALYTKFKRDIPLILSLRSPYKTAGASLKKRMAKNIYVKTILVKLIEESDAIQVPTKGFIEDFPLLKKYKDKIHVVPNGVDFQTFSKYNQKDNFTLKTINGCDKFENNLLFVGSLIPRKGIKTLLDSFELVLKKYPSTCLIIVGKGPLEEFIKNRAKNKNYLENIRLAGYVTNQEKLAKFYSYADLLVFPSLSETFGRVVLESLAAGTPCLVSKIGALMSVIDHGNVGMFAESGNPRDFAKEIIKFFEMDKNTRKQLENKVLKYASSYTWKNVARQIEEIYEELL